MSVLEAIKAASAALEAKKLPEAERLCRLALREAPGNAEALCILGYVHADRGDDLEAIRLYEQSVFFSAKYLTPYPRLALYYYGLKRLDDSVRLLTQWASIDPGDVEVQHLLAAATGRNSPEHCSESYIKSHFNEFASSFDDVLLRNLAYRAPKLIASAFEKHLPSSGARIDVLDAGCGTGLCGPQVRQWCRSLIGVDLAERMIQKARDRGCYDELVVGEVCALMESRVASFDAVISADVLIYFGSLLSFFQSARDSLRPGGFLIVTTESLLESATESFRLLPSGRYAHHKSYLTKAMSDSGLQVIDIEDVVIRLELEEEVRGHRVVAVRRN